MVMCVIKVKVFSCDSCGFGFTLDFGVWILGCWIWDVFLEKRVQGVYIVFPDAFLLNLFGQSGVNHFRPFKVTDGWHQDDNHATS